MRYKKILLLFILIVTSGFTANSQSGMTFNELEQRLQPYFADALINDVRLQLPQGSSYRIWGWDVGDFSGDGFNDVAVSVKLAQDRKKNIQVFLFTAKIFCIVTQYLRTHHESCKMYAVL